MLDKLVVSKNSTKENRRIGNFLVTSFLAIASVLSVGLVYSLFSYNLAMGSDELSISTLVAPVLETEAKPEPKKEESQPDKAVSNNQNLAIRTTNTKRIEEIPTDVPDKVSVTASKVRSRPAGIFEIGKVDSDIKTTSGSANRGTEIGSSSKGISGGDKNLPTPEVVKVEKPKIAEPPELKKELPKPIENKPPPTISGGVVNGKAVNLVQPIYSSAAISMNISGKVTVQVLIDEDGNVVSANAIDGNPLLRQSAVNAARKSKFSPTFLTKQKVKVSGVIVYNFIK